LLGNYLKLFINLFWIEKSANKIETKPCLKMHVVGVDPKAVMKGILEKYSVVEKYQLKNFQLKQNKIFLEKFFF
jgi:predicted RNA-binding protein